MIRPAQSLDLPPSAPLLWQSDAERFRALVRHWPVMTAALLYLATAMYVLGTNYWTTEQGGHGPIILITGAWLLWNRSAGIVALPATRRRTTIAWLGILGFGVFSVVAAMTVKQFLQVAGTYLTLLSLLYLFIGWRQMRRLWAPLLYLAFLIPPPENWVVAVTRTLKSHIATSGVSLLATMGYPVARDGATLFIGPYELVVAAACSGLNSLVSLLAIGLFYTYLMHPRDWRYAALLAAFIIPIAIFANFARVIIIMLVTYYMGDAVGQSVIHDTLGMIVFVIALGMLILIDVLLHPLFARRAARRPKTTTSYAHG